MRFRYSNVFLHPEAYKSDTFSQNPSQIDSSLTRDYSIHGHGGGRGRDTDGGGFGGSFNLACVSGGSLIYTSSAGVILHIVSNNGTLTELTLSVQGRARAITRSSRWCIEPIYD